MVNQKRTLKFILTIIILISLFFSNIYSLAMPKAPTEDIYAQDYASMLNIEVKDDILKMSHTLQQRTSAELVVVTVPTLQDRPIEEYALNLFREWGIGSEQENNGVLLLVANEEREARIEVGYGLEGAINDGKAGAILDEMVPYFQGNNYSEGIATAYSMLINEIAVEYNIDINEIFQGAQNIKPAALPQPASITDTLKSIGFLLLITIIGMLLFSKILGKNLFILSLLLLKDVADGKYAGPTGGGPNYDSTGGHRGSFRVGGHSIGSFGSRSSGSRSTIGRGKFGGGSSGGGGSSRKW